MAGTTEHEAAFTATLTCPTPVWRGDRAERQGNMLSAGAGRTLSVSAGHQLAFGEAQVLPCLPPYVAAKSNQIEAGRFVAAHPSADLRPLLPPAMPAGCTRVGPLPRTSRRREEEEGSSYM